MKITPPWSRRRATQPARVTVVPASAARRPPASWVRITECSFTASSCVRHSLRSTGTRAPAPRSLAVTAKTAATKLGIRPGSSVHRINPPGDYAVLVEGLPEGAHLVSEPPADVVHAFARTLGELATYGTAAVGAVHPFDQSGSATSGATRRPGPVAGLVWVSYPKGGASALKRDLLWDAIPGWRPVTQVAVDDLWSAMRFRPEAEIGKR